MRYKIDGYSYPGVTPIQSAVLSKQWLGQYAVNIACDLVKGGMPPDEARRAWENTGAEKMDTGSKVHELIHGETQALINGASLLRGRHNNDEINGAMAAWYTWLADVRPTFFEAEHPVVCSQWGYAGTLDAMAMIGDKMYVIDYKTHERKEKPSKPYIEHWMQVAAYLQARRSMEGEYHIDGPHGVYTTKYPKATPHGVGIVRLCKRTGRYDWDYEDAPEIIARYIHAQNLACELYYTMAKRRCDKDATKNDFWKRIESIYHGGA